MPIVHEASIKMASQWDRHVTHSDPDAFVLQIALELVEMMKATSEREEVHVHILATADEPIRS